MVLVPGVGLSHRVMLPIAELFAPHLTVRAPDPHGFGRSDKPRRPLDVPELADALAARIQAAGQLVITDAGAHTLIDQLVEASLPFLKRHLPPASRWKALGEGGELVESLHEHQEVKEGRLAVGMADRIGDKLSDRPANQRLLIPG